VFCCCARMTFRLLRDRRGQTAVIVALTLAALIGVVRARRRNRAVVCDQAAEPIGDRCRGAVRSVRASRRAVGRAFGKCGLPRHLRPGATPWASVPERPRSTALLLPLEVPSTGGLLAHIWPTDGLEQAGVVVGHEKDLLKVKLLRVASRLAVTAGPSFRRSATETSVWSCRMQAVRGSVHGSNP
jgi:hypothetical protein